MIALTVEGKKTFSAAAAASSVTFHINAMDRTTAETVKAKLTEKAPELITTVEIKDGVRRLGQHMIGRIESLSTSDVTVEIGMNVDCCSYIII